MAIHVSKLLLVSVPIVCVPGQSLYHSLSTLCISSSTIYFLPSSAMRLYSCIEQQYAKKTKREITWKCTTHFVTQNGSLQQEYDYSVLVLERRCFDTNYQGLEWLFWGKKNNNNKLNINQLSLHTIRLYWQLPREVFL